MKQAIFILAFFGTFAPTAFGQEKPVKFTVEVSTDSVLFGNWFEVKFTLENAGGQRFEAPDFSNFNIVSGPNQSSSMSMVNGEVTQSMSVTYYLEPKETGSFFIAPASIEADGEPLETSPLEVLVVPNPDGIRQAPPRGGEDFQFRWGGDPFDLDRDFPPPAEPPAPPPPPPQKKKRKTTRI